MFCIKCHQLYLGPIDIDYICNSCIKKQMPVFCQRCENKRDANNFVDWNGKKIICKWCDSNMQIDEAIELAKALKLGENA